MLSSCFVSVDKCWSSSFKSQNIMCMYCQWTESLACHQFICFSVFWCLLLGIELNAHTNWQFFFHTIYCTNISIDLSRSFPCLVLILNLFFSGWIVSKWCNVSLHCWNLQLILNAIVMLHNLSVMLLKCQGKTSILQQSGQIQTRYLTLSRRT
jgi:hypothetical protein